MLFQVGCANSTKAQGCDALDRSMGPADFKVDVTEYFHVERSKKMLVIMPPTGGTNYADRSYAKRFCKSGYDVTILNEWTGDNGTSTDLEIHQGFYTKMLKAVGLVLDQSTATFNGMLGTSLGGLYAAVASAKIPKIDAIFTIVAGVPITKVVVTSEQKAMRDLARTRNQRFGFRNDVEYLAALQKAFSLEPNPENVKSSHRDYGVVIADEDVVVPTATQNALRDLWKPKKEIHLANGHFWAIFNTWLYHNDEVVQFFEESSAARAAR